MIHQADFNKDLFQQNLAFRQFTRSLSRAHLLHLLNPTLQRVNNPWGEHSKCHTHQSSAKKDMMAINKLNKHEKMYSYTKIKILKHNIIHKYAWWRNRDNHYIC